MSKAMKRVLKALVVAPMVAGMGLLGVPSADAATQTASFTVDAEVQAACTITASPVDFGIYDINSGTDNDAQGSVTINCSTGAPVFVTLDDGATPGAGSTPAAPVREMASGTNRLGYGLFADAGRTTVWEGVTGVSSVGINADEVIPVFGRIPAGQAVASGLYQDTVIATVNF